MQRVRYKRKGFQEGGVETQMNFAYAKGRAETRPDAIKSVYPFTRASSYSII